MTDTTKKLEISPTELDIIASALETQTKILSMQASAGGHGANTRLNDIKRLLATVTQQTEKPSGSCTAHSGFWGLFRSKCPAT
jgi:hypothetical protein